MLHSKYLERGVSFQSSSLDETEITGKHQAIASLVFLTGITVLLAENSRLNGRLESNDRPMMELLRIC